MLRSPFHAVLAVIMGLACGRDSPKPFRPSPPAAAVSLQDFQDLRYLEGGWRARSGPGRVSFEQYAFLDDSTIEYTFYRQDSLFTTPVESSVTRWSNGHVVSGQKGLSLRATSWGRDTVRFDPHERAINGETWIRLSPDSWIRTLDLPGTSVPELRDTLTRVQP
jgi:hypothetical protein